MTVFWHRLETDGLSFNFHDIGVSERNTIHAGVWELVQHVVVHFLTKPSVSKGIGSQGLYPNLSVAIYVIESPTSCVLNTLQGPKYPTRS